MPKKAKPETQAEQSARFRREVKRLIDAGELNPIEAEARFEAVLKRAAPERSRRSEKPPEK